MKFENLKLWLSLPVVLFQYWRDVKAKYRQEGASPRCRYCVVAIFVVVLAATVLVLGGTFKQVAVSQLSAFAAD